MFEHQNLKENVDLLTKGSKKIILVGTAHISHQSADLAREIIAEYRPQSVAIELCPARFESIQNPDRWKDTDLLSVLRQGKGYVLLSQLLLSAFQKKLAGQLKITPGAEMLAAIASAQAIQAEITLADREVKTTLKRTWGALGIWSMAKLTISMLSGVLGDIKIDEQEIERLKRSDVLQEMMREFSDAFPEVRKTLIDERDAYLAEKIKQAPGDIVVAIIGAGHIPGIIKTINETIDLAALETLPRPSLLKQSLSWILPGIVLAMIIYGFFAAGASASLSMITSWIWINAVCAATGALIAGAHPISILAAGVAAPLTSLHPLLASGFFSGIAEAWIRKPKVRDLETIADDITSVKGWWSNGASRILLVMALTNLVGTIGTIIGTYVIATKL
jgi:pheromone shutdown-related protein TraB